jgi:hypothetical protein
MRGRVRRVRSMRGYNLGSMRYNLRGYNLGSMRYNLRGYNLGSDSIQPWSYANDDDDDDDDDRSRQFADREGDGFHFGGHFFWEEHM